MSVLFALGPLKGTGPAAFGSPALREDVFHWCRESLRGRWATLWVTRPTAMIRKVHPVTGQSIDWPVSMVTLPCIQIEEDRDAVLFRLMWEEAVLLPGGP